MVVYATRRADLYFTVSEFQFRALYESFELVERHFGELIERRGFPSWDGDPSTSGTAAKAYIHQSMVDNLMPQAFRSSMLVALWGVYESSLILIASTISRLNKNVPLLTHGTKFLNTAKIYFENQLNIQLFSDNIMKNEVIGFQKIRNILMHVNGLSEVTKKGDLIFLSSYMHKHAGVGLERGFLELSAEFVRSCFEVMASAMQHIFAEARAYLHAIKAP